MKSDKDFHIDAHYMVIVGRYFETNNDFINLVKTSKRYKSLLEIYRFNPIRDRSLFPNVQTLHIYEKGDFDIERYNDYINSGIHFFQFWKAEYSIVEKLQRRNIIEKCIIKRYDCPRICHNWNEWNMDVRIDDVYMLQNNLFYKSNWIDTFMSWRMI